MLFRALPLILILPIAACSSDSDKPDNGTGSTPPGTSDSAFRIATTISDEGDGTPDFMFEYDYDAAGRIVTISRTNLTVMSEPSVST